MDLSYLLGLLVSLSSAFRRRLQPQRGTESPGPRGSALRLAALGSATTCLLYWLERIVVEFAGAHQHADPAPAWYSRLPLGFLLQGTSYHMRWEPWLVVVLQALALAQCASLLCLYVAFRNSGKPAQREVAIVAAAALFMLALGLRSHTMSGDDLYLYAGLALAKPSAYHPSALPFGGDHTLINQLWGTPLFPSPYGPLWILISKIAVSTSSDLAAQLVALRSVQVLALVCSTAALFAVTRTLLLPALLVLNPVVYDLYVVDAHNDLTGISFVLAAAAARKRLWLAVPLAAAAGLIKLPFVLVAMMAFAAERTLKQRAVPALTSAAIAAAASALLVGRDYLWALQQGFLIYGGPIPTEARIFQILLAAVATLAVGMAIVWRRYIAGAAWSFIAFGHFPFPWYLGWGVPFAALCEPPVIAFFAGWPIANALLAPYYPPSPIVSTLRYGLIIALCVVIVLRLRRLRSGPVPIESG